jgi:predicted DsbA family dithiol-disulfide isomerase
MAKQCSYNFNGERKTGKTPEECAKLAARFKKSKEKMQREFDSISGRKRKEKPNPDLKKKKTKKRNFLQKIFNKTKEEKLAKAKLKKIKDSRKRNLDRNAIN